MKDKLIAFLGQDNTVIEVWCVQVDLVKIIQRQKDDKDRIDVIYIQLSQVKDLITVLKKCII